MAQVTPIWSFDNPPEMSQYGWSTWSYGADSGLAGYDQGVAAAAQIVSLDPAEGQIDSDPNVARWTPVDIVWDLPDGHTPMILVRIGANSGLELVAYNGITAGAVPQAGWSALFSGKSAIAVEQINGGQRYTASILPNGGWHRPDVFVTPFSGHEAEQP